MQLDLEVVKDLSKKYGLAIYQIRDIAQQSNTLEEIESECQGRVYVFALAQEIFDARNQFRDALRKLNLNLNNNADVWQMVHFLSKIVVNAQNSEGFIASAGACLFVAELFKQHESRQ